MLSLNATVTHNDGFPIPDYPGPILAGAGLAARTTWRMGGPARWLVQPDGREALSRLWDHWPAEWPRLVLGGGSNLLINDDGFDGLVIDLTRNMNRIALMGAAAGQTTNRDDEAGNAVLIRAEAGAATRTLAHFARRRGLSGGEFLAGIPGSIGGALRINAGAYGGEIKDILLDVELLDTDGNHHHWPAERLKMSYRRVGVPAGWLFLAARFRFQPGDAGIIRQRMQRFNRQRRDSQPLGFASAGSTFKNPPRGPKAWQWIDAAGLRGAREGEAQVSEKHSNFLINRGRATAREMFRLIDRVREGVLKSGGIQLELEVGIVDRNGLRW